MESEVVVLAFLTEDELQNTPNTVIEKVALYLKSKDDEVQELKVELEKFRVKADQQCFDLEKQLEESAKKLEIEQNRATQFEVKADEYETKLDKALAELKTLKESVTNCTTQLETSKCQQKELAEEKKELLRILEKRNVESEQLKDELRAVANQYTTANQAKNNLLLTVDQLSCQESALKHQVSRLEQDKQALTKEVEHLSNEVSQVTNSLYTARTEQMHKNVDLQSKLDKATEELRLIKDVKESLQKVVDSQNSKLEAMSLQLKEQRDANIKAESQFGLGLQSQVKLTNLYKESLEESQERVNELLTAVQEMQKLLKQAVEDNTKLNENFELEKEKYQTEISESGVHIAKLEDELEKANGLLEHLKKRTLSDSDVESLSPSAAAASRLLKSGKSLTQIYAEYIDITDQLQEQKERNSRLTLYLGQIQQEIEDRAPCLRKQREDYEKAVGTISALTQQLNNSITQHESLEGSINEANRRCKLLATENEELKKTCSDLGQQVCCLIKKVEEGEGRLIPEHEDDSNDVSSTVVGGNSAANVITENLVTFRNVQELQAQNQRLLAVIRDLTESRQKEDKEFSDTRIAELRAELDEAIGEIKELRDARDRQNEMVKSIVRQREMYKVLLSQTAEGKEIDVTLNETPESVNLVSPNKAAQKKDNEILTALQQMKEEFALFKAKTMENNKINQEQIEKNQEERLELRLYSAKLSSQLEFTTERYNTVKDSLQGFKKEISSLSARNEQLSSLCAKHEETVCTLRNELMAIQDKLSRAEVSTENLRQERTLLKQSEARLQGENDALRRERSGQALLMTNLQAIQNNLEQSDSSTKTFLTNRISALDKEISLMRNKLDSENERYNNAMEAWEGQLRDMQAKLQMEIDKHCKTRDELEAAYSSVHELRQEISVREAKLKTLESMISKTGGTPNKGTPTKTTPAVPISDDELLQLREAHNEIEALKTQLKKSSEHLMQFKSISSSLEEQLKEQNLTNSEFQTSLENKLKEKINEISKLKEELVKAKEESSKLLEENQVLATENLVKNNELRSELHKASIDLQNALQTLEDCKKSEEEARKEFHSQSHLTREAQENYERELRLHANDLQILENLRKEYEGHGKKLESAEEAARKAEFALKASTSSWKEQEKCFIEQIGHLDIKCNDLEGQNRLLHEQMEKISGQMMALQSKEGLNVSFSESPNDQSSEHLLEIIKYLRKEKDIALAKQEVAVTENERLSAKVKFLEKRLDETSTSLREFQKKEQVSLSSASQHAELMRKVELLNILTDGNRALRDEKNELAKSVQELKAKVTKLETEVAPLKERNQDIASQRDALLAERKALQAEAKRWQSRTQTLVEQTNKTNPEEYKKALQEKDQFQKQASAAKEELARLKSDMSGLEAMLAAVRKELENGKGEIQNKNREIARISSELVSKESSLTELNKTMQQVRKIGRKYKAQYDELKVQFEALNAQAEQAAEKASVVSTEPVPNLTEAVEAAKQEVRQEMEVKIKEAEEAQKATDEKFKKLRQNAYQKITKLSTLRDEQTAELQILKSKISGLEQSKNEDNLQSNNLQNCLENRVSELERDLKEANNSTMTLNKDNTMLKKEVEELTSKVAQQQKQMDILHKQLKDATSIKSASTSSIRDSSILAQSSADSIPPPTANIKPMAAPGSSVVRHPHPPGSSMRSTPMGRIRPITASSHAASRTATIPPTSAAHSQHQDILEDAHTSPSSSSSMLQSTSSVPQATVAPTPVVAVSAMISSSPVVHETSQTTPIAHQSISDDSIPAPESMGSCAEIDEKFATFNAELSAYENMLDMEMPFLGTHMPEIGATSAESASASQSQENLKRHREETEFDAADDEFLETAVKKRACIGEDEKGHSVSSKVTHLSDHPNIAIVQASTSQKITFHPDNEAGNLPSSSIKPQGLEDTDVEVILVDSDEEEDEKIAEQDVTHAEEEVDDGKNVVEDDDEEEEDEDEEEEEEEQTMPEQFEDEEGESEEEKEAEDEATEDFHNEDAGNTEEHFPGEEVDDNEDNDIEIIEQGEDQQEGEAQNVQELEPPTVQAQSSHPMYLPRIPSHSDRYQTTLGRQQPASYSLMSSNTGFEDGDSIVPSTPTLFDSRRNDGFAEAVSSPHIPPERFLFGNTVETPSQLASQGALGMDDTRMDLTQFDDGTGRSVPSTPHQVSPLEGSGGELTSEATGDGASVTSQGQPSETAISNRVSGTLNLPSITITSDDSSTVALALLDESENNTAKIPDSKAADAQSDFQQSGSSDGPKIVSVTSLGASSSNVDERRDESESGNLTVESVESESGTTDVGDGDTQRAEQDQHPQRRTTPIVWDPPRPPSRGSRAQNRGRGHQQQQQQQSMNRPYARRSRPMQNPSPPRMGFRHMGRGRMMPRGRPYQHQRHPNNFQ